MCRDQCSEILTGTVAPLRMPTARRFPRKAVGEMFGEELSEFPSCQSLSVWLSPLIGSRLLFSLRLKLFSNVLIAIIFPEGFEDV